MGLETAPAACGISHLAHPCAQLQVPQATEQHLHMHPPHHEAQGLSMCHRCVAAYATWMDACAHPAHLAGSPAQPRRWRLCWQSTVLPSVVLLQTPPPTLQRQLLPPPAAALGRRHKAPPCRQPVAQDQAQQNMLAAAARPPMLGLAAATSPWAVHGGQQAGRCCCVWWAANCLRASTLETTWAGEGGMHSGHTTIYAHILSFFTQVHGWGGGYLQLVMSQHVLWCIL